MAQISTFKDQNRTFVPILMDPLAKAFNFTPDQMQHFDFLNLTSLYDFVIAETFEGNPRGFRFTGEQMYYLRNT